MGRVPRQIGRLSMQEKRIRLADGFLAVFPELTADQVNRATSPTVQSRNSVTGVTLPGVVEGEVGISIEVEDVSRFNLFLGLPGSPRAPALSPATARPPGLRNLTAECAQTIGAPNLRPVRHRSHANGRTRCLSMGLPLSSDLLFSDCHHRFPGQGDPQCAIAGLCEC